MFAKNLLRVRARTKALSYHHDEDDANEKWKIMILPKIRFGLKAKAKKKLKKIRVAKWVFHFS